VTIAIRNNDDDERRPAVIDEDVVKADAPARQRRIIDATRAHRTHCAMAPVRPAHAH
jgi:hypothetical protein